MEEVRLNDASNTVFLDAKDEDDILFLARIVSQIPLEIGGMGGYVGFKYEAMKDFMKMYKIPKKLYLSMFWELGQIWANGVNNRKK